MGEGGDEAGSKAMYKRLYGILWVRSVLYYHTYVHTDVGSVQYGSGKTLGVRGAGNSTYVYPSAVKAVVRAHFTHTVKDWQDPVGPQVRTHK